MAERRYFYTPRCPCHESCSKTAWAKVKRWDFESADVIKDVWKATALHRSGFCVFEFDLATSVP